MEKQRNVRVAAIQFEPEPGAKAANIARLEDLARQAAAGGAKIIVMPEMATTGLFFQDRQHVAPYVEPVPGETTARFARLAREIDAYIAVGLPEVDPQTNIYFNCAVLVGPDGLIGKHRKVHSYLSDPLWAADGDLGFQVWETPLGKLGMMICMDANYPESGRLLGLAGADVMLMPVGWVVEICPAPLWIMRAFDNGISAIVANRWGSECGQQFSGGSAIINPDSTVQQCLERTTDDKIVFGEIDCSSHEQLPRRRPELYGDLVLNRYLWNPFDMHGYFGAQPLPSGGKFRATACQFEPHPLEHQLSELERLRKGSPGDQPLLFVLPEFSFAVPPNSYQEAVDHAETLEGETVKRLAEWCGATGSYIAAGLIEQDRDKLYNTLVLVGPDGLCARYRKTHLSREDRIWASAGDSFAWADTPLGRIGLLTGTDLLLPEPVRCLAINAVDVVCVCAALNEPAPIYRQDFSPKYDQAVHWHLAQTRAGENDVHVIFANQFGNSGVFFGPTLFGDPMRQSLAAPSGGILAASMEIDTSMGQAFRSKPALARRLPGMYYALLKVD